MWLNKKAEGDDVRERYGVQVMWISWPCKELSFCTEQHGVPVKGFEQNSDTI